MPRFTLLDKIMLAGMTQFAGVIVLELIVLINLITSFPGSAGGGDALLMIMLFFVSYSVACVVLLPALLYRLYRKSRGENSSKSKGRLITWGAVCVITLPPLLVYVLPFMRWVRRFS